MIIPPLFLEKRRPESYQRVAKYQAGEFNPDPLPLPLSSTTRQSNATKATMSIPAGPLSIGDQIEDRYEVQSILYQGGNSTLYRVLDSIKQRHYVLKVWHKSVHQNLLLQKQLNRIVQYLAPLKHSGIVRIRKVFQGPFKGMLMDELKGESLQDVLSRCPDGLTTSEALRMIRSITHTVSFLHKHKIVHGDLKPGNLFVADNGRLILLDFDCAQYARLKAGQWVCDVPRALTPAFASHALLSGLALSIQDDYYSLGCLFYMMLSGQHPFFYKTSRDVVERTLQPERIPILSDNQWQGLRQLLSIPLAGSQYTLTDFERQFFARRHDTQNHET